MAQIGPALATCVGLAGTADGFDKDTAVSRAQRSLEDYIQQYKADDVTAGEPDILKKDATRVWPGPGL